MVYKYVYKDEVYNSSWAVRQAIGAAENIAFGDEPKEGRKEFWAELGVTYTEEPDPEPSEEEKEAARLAEAKRVRAEKVAAIKVTVDGMVFDGDETAQSRMARAVTAADVSGRDSTVWILADNTVATVTKAQLQQALALAMIEMGKVWPDPYEQEEEKVDTLGVPPIGINP